MGTVRDHGAKRQRLDQDISDIHRHQSRARFQAVSGTIIGSLVRCLVSQQLPSYQAAVAGDVDHFQTEKNDSGWGCGWRNIQMVCSHLLRHDKDMEAALFKGCGFVPDLLSLQAWLECAWKAGFDTAGGDMLGNVMQGSHQWIGTTECAALLRFFGLKAQIIDFTGGLKNPNIQANDTGEQMHMGVACDNCEQCPIVGPRYNSQVVNNYDLCEACHNLPGADNVAPFRLVQNEQASHNKAGVTVNPTEADKNQQNTLPHLRLMEWVWSYFVVTNLYEGTSESSEDDQSTKAGAVHAQPSKQTRGANHWQHQEERSSKHQKTGSQQTNGKSGADYEASGSNSSAAVTRSGKPPLYFQHEGHSRTIIGIERFRPAVQGKKGLKEGCSDDGFQYHLLLLDPSFKTNNIASALSSGHGWQKVMKQGIHNLRSQQYQLLFVDDGIVHGKEQEEWKVLKASETY